MKVLVAGCGSIGRRHAVNAAALAETAVFDLDLELGARCAADLGIRAFVGLDEALAWGPQAVVVATPHRSHLEVAGAALAADVDVLIEKPLSHSLAGVDDLLHAVATCKRRAFVVCNMRFHPGPETLRRHLHEVGRPLFATAHFGNFLPYMRPGSDYRQLYAARKADGGGVILDAIHEVDYLSWLFGPVGRVGCRATTIGDLDIDTEDYAELSLFHSGSMRSLVQLDYMRRRKSRGCEVVGDKGTLIWYSDGKNPEHCTVRIFDDAAGVWRDLLVMPTVDTARPYVRLMEEFLKEVAGDGSGLLLDARDAAHELGVALSAHASAASGGSERTIFAGERLEC